MSAFACTACGHAESKWWAQCPRCQKFSTFKATAQARTGYAPAPVAAPHVPARLARMNLGNPDIVSSVRAILDPEDERPESVPVPITQIATTLSSRIACGIEPVDRVLGGDVDNGGIGLVVGSAVLIGGMPGAGKTTLLMQWLAGIGMPILYASGEESTAQIALNARRIGAAVDRIHLVAETDADRIIQHARKLRPVVMAIDSVQTLTVGDVSGEPGSPTQVKASAGRIREFCKLENITVIFICQIVKDGKIAGPKTLEHLVDAVLSLKVDEDIGPRFRFLSARKNRFGSTAQVGALEMTATGLVAADAGVMPSDGSEGEDGDDDGMYQPLAQELLNRYLADGGRIDAGLRDRIGSLLDLDMWRETRHTTPGARETAPAARWPYGPASMHEAACRLHQSDGAGYCDCKASAADDTEHGDGAWPTPLDALRRNKDNP